MIETFVHVVSAVMKLWHWLLDSVIGMPSSAAWVASVLLLVVTVRAMIAPLTWISYKTGRLTVIMRPKLAAIAEKYRTDATPEGVKAQEAEKRQVHKDHRYNPYAGCLPALLQIPFFLGLYRLLLWMAVPERAQGHSLGLLTPAEVASFQQAAFFGVPLPASVKMTPEQYAHLGTSLGEVRSVAIPLLLCAIVFTTFNLILSQLRTRSTLQWDDRSSRRIYRFVWFFVPLVPFLIGTAGMSGRIPVALLLYWFTGNLWTLGQTIVLWLLLVKHYPLDDAARAHIADSRATHTQQRHDKRARVRARRLRKLKALAKPTTIPAVHRELRAEKKAARDAKRKAKAEQKALAKKRGEARKEAGRRARAARKKPRPESSFKPDQME